MKNNQQHSEYMLENVRKGQWLCPYLDDEDLIEVVVYFQHGLWYVMHELQVYLADEEHTPILRSFSKSHVTWDELLERVILPTLDNSKHTFMHQYKGFSINDPVYHFYVDGVEQDVEYLEGPGVNSNSYPD